MNNFLIETFDDRRAMSDAGCAVFMKNSSGKYSLFLPMTGIPAIGSAPEQIETTVTTSVNKVYIKARKDNPQIELTAFLHRDNIRRVNAIKGMQKDFLVVFADYTGVKFSGEVSTFSDAVELGNLANLKVTITVSTSDDSLTENVSDLLQKTVKFTTAIQSVIEITGTGTYELPISTDPSDATVTVATDTAGVATAAYATGKVTVTGVTAGSAIITINAAKTDLASNFTTVLVLVK